MVWSGFLNGTANMIHLGLLYNSSLGAFNQLPFNRCLPIRRLASKIENDYGLTGQKHVVAVGASLLCHTYVLKNTLPCETISFIAKIEI